MRKLIVAEFITLDEPLPLRLIHQIVKYRVVDNSLYRTNASKNRVQITG